MRTTSILELHDRTAELVSEAAEGGVIVIERDGQPIAELRPIPTTPAPRLPLTKEQLWACLPQTGNSTPMIEEDRNR